MQHNFSQKSVILHACVHGRWKEFFFGSHQWIFPKAFLRGVKRGEICFLPLKIKKRAFFTEIFKFLPSSDIHMFVCRKSSCHTIKKI